MTAAGASDVGHLPRIGTLLGVWARPHDEVSFSSGLMSRVRNHGGRVVVVTATDGGRGTDVPGVHERHRLRHRHGELARTSLDRGAAELLPVLEDVRPDVILTFGPDGMSGHEDQRAVSAWTTEAWRRTGRRADLWYAARRCEARYAAVVQLTGPLLVGKVRALRGQESRTPASGRAWWSVERFVAAEWVLDEVGLTGA